jgi:hypothetical protein
MEVDWASTEKETICHRKEGFEFESPRLKKIDEEVVTEFSKYMPSTQHVS